MTTQHNKNSIKLQVLMLAIVKWVIGTGIRMVYPFLPSFARGFGISLTKVSNAISLRAFTGIFVPLLAPFAERNSRRQGMLLGIGIFILGTGLVIIWPVFPVFIFALCLNLFGGYYYIACLQSYLGDEIPYEERGKAIGTTELSWSLAFILGVPMIGLAMDHFGWKISFPILLIAGILSFFLILGFIPKKNPELSQSIIEKTSVLNFLKMPNVLSGLVMSLCFGVFGEVIYLVFGVWMEDSYQLNLAALGAVSALIGFSEFGGEALSTWLTDRFGKKRSILLGVTVHGLVTLSLIWLGNSLWGALIGLFLYGLSFEFAFVSSLPLMSELLPEARATLLSSSIAAQALGRAIGAFLALRLYHWGFSANVFAALFFMIILLITLNTIKLQLKS